MVNRNRQPPRRIPLQYLEPKEQPQVLPGERAQHKQGVPQQQQLQEVVQTAMCAQAPPKEQGPASEAEATDDVNTAHPEEAGATNDIDTTARVVGEELQQLP